MLVDQIKSDLVAAMKGGEALRVSVLRMLLSAVGYRQIDLGRSLGDGDVVGVIQSEVKKRKEAMASYIAGGRSEQAESEEKEMHILQAYLPQQMTDEEIKREIGKMNLPKGFGQAMKMVAPAFRGRADGSVVARLVREAVLK